MGVAWNAFDSLPWGGCAVGHVCYGGRMAVGGEMCGMTGGCAM